MVISFARVHQGLAITPLELNILSFVFCTYFPSVCWWHKPNDVELDHTFEIDCDIRQVFVQAAPADSGIYHNTPLDFVSPMGSFATSLTFHMDILKEYPTLLDPRPLQIISTTKFRHPSSLRALWVLITAVETFYCGTFLGAWSYEFPKRTERTMWLLMAVVNLAMTLSIGGVSSIGCSRLVV